MSSPAWPNTLVPARLKFLAIYNPSLGPTDETFADQLVFYYSRQHNEARAAAKKSGRNDAAGGDAQREETNEQLRQIGLAQGMIDFARSFSDGAPVNSVDTEKSRIVLHELERGWWILASIDLTRLPIAAPASESSKKGADKPDAGPSIEYSSREVSPPALLLQQLTSGNQIFMLHHGQSITELFIRVSREKFCSALDRYWSRFCRYWDPLLHANPAADMFNGIKLASGGELGMGVGEEEWGSGERDVLEDLVRRTEGLVDLVVSRFGDPAPSHEDANVSESESLPWLGTGSQAGASDGVVFGGVNGITRQSLRSIAVWMRHIYAYGEVAYGVRDNPLRERRKRKRRSPPKKDVEATAKDTANITTPKPAPEVAAEDYGLKAHRKQTSDTNSRISNRGDPLRPRPEQQHSQSGIPPPIVSAAEQSLANASRKAETDAGRSHTQASGTTMGIPDQYMKFLTLGLSTLGKSSKEDRPSPPRRTSTSSSKTITAQHYATPKLPSPDEEDEVNPMLTQVEPIPDGETLQARIAKQKRGEERGQFLVGLRGELDSIEADSEAGEENDDDEHSTGFRNVLRTVSVELNESTLAEEDQTELQRKLSEAGLSRGRDDPANFHRLRVLIYIHRPFMYCFLFENQTPALSMTSFYKDLHRNLLPIHKPLLSSTSAANVAQRIQETQTSDTESVVSSGRRPADASPIYDLIYDPALLTIHTSVPNIPDPGTPAAEGIVPGTKGSGINNPSLWTRIESLNVHSQIINTISSIQRNPNEYERTSKTSRGWWVVWMKLPPSSKDGEKDEEAEAEDEQPALAHVASDETIAPPVSTTPDSAATWRQESQKHDMHRIAILVRKASDSVPAAPKNTSRAASSMWNSLGLRSNATSDAITGGASAGWGPQALAGGIGIDARKYVEGLLSLGR